MEGEASCRGEDASGLDSVGALLSTLKPVC